ncbi:MAG: dicarboxylate/amino acid:cation symporter [Deltaproteobacteria bacterium]|nr:dicarboxylate/amino acid:cation symporter [Deltaproteobacteria bacterium]
MQLYTKILIGMFIGVVLGLLIGPNSSILPQDSVRLSSGVTVYEAQNGTVTNNFKGIKTAKIIKEDGDWIEIGFQLSAADQLRLKSGGVTLSDKSGNPIEPGTTVEAWVKDEQPDVRRYAGIGQILVDNTEWLGQLFLAMIKMVVVPLVFFSLVVGIASLGDVRKLGRMGGRTLGFFMMTTVVALSIGVGLANLIKPGKMLSDKDRDNLLASYSDGASSSVANAAEAPSFLDQIVSIVPSNPIGALAGGDMLQVIFFAMMLGIALTFLKDDRADLVVDVFDRLNDAMVMLVHIAMKLAPIGVGALLFKVVGNTGLSVLTALGVYALVVLAGLLSHMFFTYGLAVKFGTNLSFLPFLGAIKEALVMAFSTSSSSATLPVTKGCCEDNLNVSAETTSFVLPLGATVNMDGTALYQGVAAIFIAQIYGMDLSMGDQVTIVVSATLASVGAAGVPGAGMITLAMVLTAIGVPTEGLALILGVDRILDMFRTATNVVGDSTATVLMAHLEGESLKVMSDAEDASDPTKGFEGRLDHGQQSVQAENDPQ